MPSGSPTPDSVGPPSRRGRALRLVWVLCLAITACEPQPAFHYVYSPSGLILRSEPDPSGSVLEILPYGAPLNVVEDSDRSIVMIDSVEGRWLEARSGLATGYVFDGYLTRFPPPADPDSIPSGSPARKAFVFGANLVSIRNRPSTDSGPLAFVSYGDSVQVLLAGFSEASDSLDGVVGDWVRVRWAGVEGFLFDGYLSEFRPLSRRFSTTSGSFTTAFVQGTDTLPLRLAPDSAAESVIAFRYGDSVRVVRPPDPERQQVRGLPGAWVYARTPSGEGFLFDAFLSDNPPPSPDSASVENFPPPGVRYVIRDPGIRLWQPGERLVTKAVIVYGDSVLMLHGGRTSLHIDPSGMERAFLTVKSSAGEGLVESGTLSHFPPPIPGTPFREYMDQLGIPPEVTEPGDSTIAVRYEYRLPGTLIGQAFALLKASRENDYFASRELPRANVSTSDFDVTVLLAPGGALEGLYVLDGALGELISIDTDEDGVVVGFGPSVSEEPDSVTVDTLQAAGPATPDTATIRDRSRP